MAKFQSETLQLSLAVVGAFLLAGSIAGQDADALPVTTANSAEFKNDINIGGGLDGVSKDRKVVTSAITGIYTYRADSNRAAGDITITPTTDTTVFGALGNIHTHGTFGYTDNAKRDETDSVIRKASKKTTKTDNPLTSEGYIKLSKKIGNDATIGAVYYKDAIAPELAIRNGDLVLAAGYQFGDRHSITGSAAYSIGNFSPFAAYRDKAMHYGAEFQLGNNAAVQAAYRPDGNQYSVGLRLDIGTGGTTPAPKIEQLPLVQVPAPAPTNYYCANGYHYDLNFGGCAKKIEAPTRVSPPDIKNIRGRG
jgi:ribosomal protein S8